MPLRISHPGLDTIVIRRTDPVLVVLAGELTTSTAPPLRRLLVSLVEQGRRRILVDLASVEFVDADGVGVLAAARRRADTSAGVFAVVNPREPVARALHLAGLRELLLP